MWRTSRKISAAIRHGSFRCRQALVGHTRLSSTAKGQEDCKECGLPAEGAKSSVKVNTPITPPPEQTPPPPPNSGGGFFKILGVTLLGLGLGSGGLIGYAWYDDRFKKNVENNVPYAKDAFSHVFPYLPNRTLESKPTGEAANVNSLVIGDPNKAKEQSLLKRRAIEPADDKASQGKLQSIQKSESLKPVQTKTNIVKRTDAKTDDARSKDQQEKDRLRRIQEKEAEEAADNAVLEIMLDENMGAAVNLAREATELQHIATEASKMYTNNLKMAMDDTKEVDNASRWPSVSEAYEAWKRAAERAEKKTIQARESFEKFRYCIEDGKKAKSTNKNKLLISSQENLNKMLYDLNNAVSSYSKAESEAHVMKQYRELVEKGKEQFKKELESIMPDVKIGDKKGRGKTLTEEELNSLIAHAHRRIEQLQCQLAEQQAMEQLRLQNALERQKVQDEAVATEIVAIETENKHAEWMLQKQKADQVARLAFEQELRHELALQAAAHSQHIQDLIRMQEKEFDNKLDLNEKETILAQQEKFNREVGGAMARLQGIEAAVEARAEIEKRGRKAQELWLSCQTLLERITEGDLTGNTCELKLKPLANEFMTVREAGDQHPFVMSLVSTVPDEALHHGVWTEECLRQRFRKVRRVCKRVAMLDDESGGTLVKYFLSYLQSFLVFNSLQAKSDKDEIVAEKLDTYDLLAHAAYFLENGDLETAIRFMNRLRGEPENVASDWIKEARLLLETKQIALALNAHASACGLGTLF